MQRMVNSLKEARETSVFYLCILVSGEELGGRADVLATHFVDSQKIAYRPAER